MGRQMTLSGNPQEGGQTDGQTNATKYIISLLCGAMQSIIMHFYKVGSSTIFHHNTEKALNWIDMNLAYPLQFNAG